MLAEMMFLFQSLMISFALITKANAFNLKSGDLILQSNSCYLCSLIEAEEKSPYSHMGILVMHQGSWKVLESWGSARMSNLNEFLSRRKVKSASLILRLKSNLKRSSLSSNILISRFENEFSHLSYDENFLWNNKDQNGEKLYCSEMVAKFLLPFLLNPIQTKSMHFNVNREYWIKYFHGNPPDGEPGLSPGDFEKSPLFNHVGLI